MRVILGIVAGITATIIGYIVWQPAIDRRLAEHAIAWVFTHNPPATHPDCKPRYRTYHHGVETSQEQW
jgi:hypothetical protein